MAEKNPAGQRYYLKIAYDGGEFAGFQKQPRNPSVQETIEQALKVMSKGHAISIIGSGRTDAGVHANGQVIHLDYPLAITSQGLLRALNSLLPTAIRILEVKTVEPHFHARYHSDWKAYRYHVNQAKIQRPFERQYVLHHPYQTDLAKMARELPSIIGEHDFTSFCSTKTDKENLVRRIDIARLEMGEGGRYAFYFQGNGFLYNMIRILVGTLLQIGDGLRAEGDLHRVLIGRNRQLAGPTAAAHGLFLEEVHYPPLAIREAKTALWLEKTGPLNLIKDHQS